MIKKLIKILVSIFEIPEYNSSFLKDLHVSHWLRDMSDLERDIFHRDRKIVKKAKKLLNKEQFDKLISSTAKLDSLTDEYYTHQLEYKRNKSRFLELGYFKRSLHYAHLLTNQVKEFESHVEILDEKMKRKKEESR